MVVHSYRGWVHENRLYAYGRLQKETNVRWKEQPRLLENFLNTWRRLESDEIPHHPIEIHWGFGHKKLTTNSEGFFKIDEQIENLNIAGNPSVEVHFTDEFNTLQKTTLPLVTISSEAKYIVVSDIDDTILHSHVLSKWKLAYHSFLQDPRQRKAISGMNTWYQQLSMGVHPIIYISNSPWNFYDALDAFLQWNQFPEGPILLRDFGRQKQDSLQQLKEHKYNEIENLLQRIPLPFILIGDGGERDAAIYTELQEKYPDRIQHIFIRRVGDEEHQQRMLPFLEKGKGRFSLIENGEEGERVWKELQQR
jgi:phosphatidate phosphatase APP1